MSARLFATRCASRSRATGSRRSRAAARARRSSSSRLRCRFPGANIDPRQQAVSAVSAELERLGISTGYQTFLVAPGLARRTSQRELESLVTPELARRFHGNVLVHDVEDPDLVVVAESSRPPLRVSRALVETDLVIVISAAESVLHGGPATLLAASGADALRAAGAYSLLETTRVAGLASRARARARARAAGAAARRLARAEPSAVRRGAARLSVRPRRARTDRALSSPPRLPGAAGSSTA